MLNNRVYIDCEVYKDYFLLSALQENTGKIIDLEMFEGHRLNRKALHSLMCNHQTISFNGLGYDLLIITAAIVGYNNKALKRLSDEIITSKKPHWQICRDENLEIPQWDHIDLIQVAPGQASLKIYAGRLGAKTLQDLPLEPSASITHKLRSPIREYCHNDLHVTKLLCDELTPQIELREKMSSQYGMDLRSKSDAQIAETIITSELNKLTGKRYKRPNNGDYETFNYQNPGIIDFGCGQLNATFQRILATKFELSGNGSVAMPPWLKAQKIEVGFAEYQMGIGGLHSCEKKQRIEPNDNELLFELDVASYYPNIILQQNLAPKSMGKPFLDVYQSIVRRRLAAKKSGDAVTAHTLKIAVNGSFGKLGSKYSALYAPELLIQTTITGQLALLMLIESLELNGIRTVSANTDGIVVLCDKSDEALVEELAFDWMLSTSYELERTDYRLLVSRDVNNYLAVTTENRTKGKGVFAKPSLAKNPDAPIIYEAVSRFVVDGTPLDETIRGCTEVTKFLKLRAVTGGAIFRGVELGKAVRFYYSSDSEDNITYKKNGNKVPKSDCVKPMMVLGDVPADVDYQRYIEEAKALLEDIGC